MLWAIALLALFIAAIAVLTYLMNRGRLTDIPEGWQPPGDHVVDWVSEHDCRPKNRHKEWG